MKEKFKNLVAVFVGLLFTAILLEVVLHFYNPFPTRVKGNKIVLKTNFKRTIEINPPVKGLEREIYYSTNKLGFRGQPKPENYSSLLTIFTVGGSTTECSLISDNKTWTALLGKKLEQHFNNTWINNAGIDGCSTYGHNILLDDYILKLKPKVILFMIGINDRGMASFENEDGFLIDRKESFIRKLIKKSELINLCGTLYMRYKAQKAKIGYDSKGYLANQKPETMEEIQLKVSQHQGYQQAYAKRVELLISKCKSSGILPVIISQTLVDPDSTSEWKVMELYNSTSQNVADQQQVPFIDLGKKFEKKPEYFMDQMHFTLEGSQHAAEVIFNQLQPILADRFSSYKK